MLPLGDEHGHRAMAQVLEASGFTDRGGSHRDPRAATKAGAAQESAAGSGEHEARRGRVGGQVLGREVGDGAGEGDLTTGGPGLGFGECEAALDLGEGEGTVKQVQVLHLRAFLDGVAGRRGVHSLLCRLAMGFSVRLVG